MSLKKLASLIFHRTAVVALLLLAQIGIYVLVLLRFSEYIIAFDWFCMLLSVLVVLWIVAGKRDPGYKIAWIIPILLFPLFGGAVYLLVGGGRLSRRRQNPLAGVNRRMAETLAKDNKAQALAPLGRDAVNQAAYLERWACCPAYTNTATRYYPLGDDAFADMLSDLERAERYIFLEYFIIEPGVLWDSILEILTRKAQAGVDVRVIYDDVGSLYTLPAHYPRMLEERGIRCCVFNRFIPVLSIRLNNRDHRKFCIVDGRVAFTGGINLADEYINRRVKYGHWKDSVLRLEGDGAWSITAMFLSMWDGIRGETEDYEAFRPAAAPVRLPAAGECFVQPYTDSPVDDEPVGQTVYLNLISKAKKYVYITTPYLIISDSVNTALCNAAKSGVDVRIITPHIPDKRVIFEVTRAHYQPLLEAGVKIYEYTPGFIHAKNFVVDDIYGVVGSVNLDYRSFFLHFEAGVLLFHDPCIADIKADFLDTQEKSQAISLERCRNHSLPRRLLRMVLRLFAPLM